jgi:hypothetical protein
MGNKGVIWIVVIVVAVIVVLGVLLGWFGNDPLLAPFDATVSLQNALPTIVAFRATVDDVPTGLGRVTPIPGNNPSAVTAHVTFIVEDPDYDFTTQPEELPGIDAANTITVGDISGAGDVYVILTAPTNAPQGSGVTRAAASCTASSCHLGTDTDCDVATVAQGDGTDFTKQVKYTCDVSMNYYDAPGPGTLPAAPGVAGQDYWHIEAQIEDNTGNQDTVTSGTTDHDGQANYDFDDSTCTGAVEVGDCDYIDYFTVSDVDINSGDGPTGFERLLWAGIQVSNYDTAANDDNTIDNPDTGLTLRNIGNTVIGSLDLQPNDLTEDPSGSAVLHAESMSIGIVESTGSNIGACDVDDVAVGGSAGGTAPWDGIQLDPETPITDLGGATGPAVLNTFDIPYTAAGATTDQNELFFCVWARLDSATDCEGAACIDGSASSFSANDACTGACDTAGEKWEVTFNS